MSEEFVNYQKFELIPNFQMLKVMSDSYIGVENYVEDSKTEIELKFKSLVSEDINITFSEELDESVSSYFELLNAAGTVSGTFKSDYSRDVKDNVVDTNLQFKGLRKRLNFISMPTVQEHGNTELFAATEVINKKHLDLSASIKNLRNILYDLFKNKKIKFALGYKEGGVSLVQDLYGNKVISEDFQSLSPLLISDLRPLNTDVSQEVIYTKEGCQGVPYYPYPTYDLLTFEESYSNIEDYTVFFTEGVTDGSDNVYEFELDDQTLVFSGTASEPVVVPNEHRSNVNFLIVTYEKSEGIDELIFCSSLDSNIDTSILIEKFKVFVKFSSKNNKHFFNLSGHVESLKIYKALNMDMVFCMNINNLFRHQSNSMHMELFKTFFLELRNSINYELSTQYKALNKVRVKLVTDSVSCHNFEDPWNEDEEYSLVFRTTKFLSTPYNLETILNYLDKNTKGSSVAEGYKHIYRTAIDKDWDEPYENETAVEKRKIIIWHNAQYNFSPFKLDYRSRSKKTESGLTFRLDPPDYTLTTNGNFPNAYEIETYWSEFLAKGLCDSVEDIQYVLVGNFNWRGFDTVVGGVNFNSLLDHTYSFTSLLPEPEGEDPPALLGLEVTFTKFMGVRTTGGWGPKVEGGWESSNPDAEINLVPDYTGEGFKGVLTCTLLPKQSVAVTLKYESEYSLGLNELEDLVDAAGVDHASNDILCEIPLSFTRTGPAGYDGESVGTMYTHLPEFGPTLGLMLFPPPFDREGKCSWNIALSWQNITGYNWVHPQITPIPPGEPFYPEALSLNNMINQVITALNKGE